MGNKTNEYTGKPEPTRDAAEQLLIDQYKIPPAEAKSLLQRIRGGDAPAMGIETEAYRGAANDEITRMRRLKMKFDKFTKIAEAKAGGYNVAPEEERFYQQVRSTHDAMVRQKAKETGRDPSMGRPPVEYVDQPGGFSESPTPTSDYSTMRPTQTPSGGRPEDFVYNSMVARDPGAVQAQQALTARRDALMEQQRLEARRGQVQDQNYMQAMDQRFPVQPGQEVEMPPAVLGRGGQGQDAARAQWELTQRREQMLRGQTGEIQMPPEAARPGASPVLLDTLLAQWAEEQRRGSY